MLNAGPSIQLADDLLVTEQGLYITEGFEAIGFPLSADATLLVPAKWGHGREIKVSVDPYVASLDGPANSCRFLDIVAPYRGS